MIFDPKDNLTVKLHQWELLQAAEQKRLIRHAVEAQGAKRQFYSPLLAQLGRWLIASGWRLQMRHSNLSSIPDLPQMRQEPIRSASKML